MGTAAGKPLVLHDSNAVAGLATRVLAHGADRILLGFPKALRGKHAKIVEWVGNPMRDAICALPPPGDRFAGRDGPLRLLVVGGSLGAQALNEIVPEAVARMPSDVRPLVVHQAGEKHIAALRDAYAKRSVEAECVAFIDDMAARYAWADFVICRGGALTISELAAVGPGRARGPAAGRHRGRAERQRAIPRRCASRVDGTAADADRGAPRCTAAVARPRACARDGAGSARPGQARRGGAGGRRLHRFRDTRMKHKVKRVHFVGIGGVGHERHCGGARHARLRCVGLGSFRKRGHAPAREAGRDGVHRASRGKRREGRRGRRVDSGDRRQSRGRGGTRARRSSRAARADACRAHAAQARHRHRGHARQDHDDEPRRVRARGRRARSDVRHRRATALRGRQRAPRQGRVPRGRSRRVRRLVPLPHAGRRGRHEHRRRPHGDLRARLREAVARVRRLPATPAVLRSGRRVHRRREREGHSDRRHETARHVRIGRGRGPPRRRRRQRGRSHAVRRQG